MKLLLKIIPLYTLLFATIANGQDSKKEEARNKGQQAIVLMDDEGKYEEAIKLLEEAQKLDPGNIVYPYEIAYAYNAKADYKKTADILEKLISHPDVYGRVYQFLGNTYDYMGQREKAIATYEAGLKKFPDAGEIYLELGNINVDKKNYNKALAYYERGIKVDPGFPSNYYWAAKIYCSSSEEVWGMIYGEIFMNMERGSARTEEMSKLLYAVYKSEIQFLDTSSINISFSKSNVIDTKESGDLKLPFPLAVYEPLIGKALPGEQTIDLASLNRIRERFLNEYFKENLDKEYPNILFDYQKKVEDAGYLEAYNYWILSNGDDEAFNRWKANNDTQWEKFMDWFGQNKMLVDNTHTFHREQY